MNKTAVPSDPFVGAWELVSGFYVGDNNTVTKYEEAELRSLKVLSEKNFSFTSTAKGQFYAAGGGEYSVENGVYTEIPALASAPEMIGQRYAFQCQLEGDTWTNSRWQGGIEVEYEVWKRIG